MNEPCVYEIHIDGHLSESWSDWFEGLAVHYDPSGETILSGTLTDQSALLGVLTRIHALNLSLVSIRSSKEAQRKG